VAQQAIKRHNYKLVAVTDSVLFVTYGAETDSSNRSKVDWLEGRNICREYCMDLVSLETPTEDMLVRRLIQKRKFIPGHFVFLCS
jgi:hypothetical protein